MSSSKLVLSIFGKESEGFLAKRGAAMGAASQLDGTDKMTDLRNAWLADLVSQKQGAVFSEPAISLYSCISLVLFSLSSTREMMSFDKWY